MSATEGWVNVTWMWLAFGSYDCMCNTGFTGNGFICMGKKPQIIWGQVSPKHWDETLSVYTKKKLTLVIMIFTIVIHLKVAWLAPATAGQLSVQRSVELSLPSWHVMCCVWQFSLQYSLVGSCSSLHLHEGKKTSLRTVHYWKYVDWICRSNLQWWKYFHNVLSCLSMHDVMKYTVLVN